MALNAYLTIPSIPGPIASKGPRTNSILALGVSHSISVATDITGAVSGSYASRPFVVTKEIDIASPLLYNALTINPSPLVLPSVTIDFWAPVLNPAPGNDGEALFYTITLSGPKIISINFNMANNLLPLNVTMPPLETVTFTYASIQWTIANGGASANAPYIG